MNTQLQDSLTNMLALVQTSDGKFEPRVITLKDALKHYILHQEEVITRRTRYDLKKPKQELIY